MDQQDQPSSSPNSPRRRKAQLDLDAALYLQSQARDVQEPNRNSSPKQGPNQIRFMANSHQQQQQQQQPNQQQQSQQLQQSIPPQSAKQQQQVLGQCHKSIDYNNALYCSNNISVDYIDCVSNNDLAPPMKGIPHCKKHLRFHRNRVEPFGPNSLADQQQQPQPLSSSNSSQNLANSTTNTSSHHQSSSCPGAMANTASMKSVIEVVATTTNTTTSSSSNNAKRIIPSSTSSIPLDLTNNNHHYPSTLDAATTALADSISNITHSSGTDNDNDINLNRESQSVLYPILVSEVKKRTYFIGSLSQDSLLGHDELYRYFPNGKVNIFVCTWNQNRKRAPMNLNDLLLPDQLAYMPDIYAIGIQEAFSSQNDYLRDWEIELQTTLGPNHVLLHSSSLGVLHLSIFIRRDLIWFCSTPEESVYNSRSMPTNMIKTKGAVSIAFRFFGTSFMFTNCHFPAHENKLKDRIDEYQKIINSIDLPKNLKLLKPRYLSNDSTARFDCVFFMGDLNFRLEQRTFDETIHILKDIFQQKGEPSYEALTQNDELLKVMETNQAFHGFDESQIKFPPTYKFLAQTNKYDRQTKRVPSYTDRILFRSKRQRHIQCLIYDWLPQLLSSDHKPVYCLFDVLVRPGHEQNMVTSLNAGLFQRTVYLEALKRRAENPESMRENGAGGSLICSIS